MPYKTPEQQHEYYQRNKDKLSEYQRIKIECGCGVTYKKRHHAAHTKTARHSNWLELNNIEIVTKTPEEVIAEQKQKQKEHQLKYRDKNRDKLRTYAKQYSQ